MQEKAVKQNLNKYLVSSAASTCGVTLATGTVLQTFLLEYGVSEQKVSIYTALVQIVQALIMLFGAKKMESVKNVVRACAVTLLLQILLPLMVIFFCLNQNVASMFVIFCVVSLFTNLLLGVYNVLCYKLPYQVIPIASYGKQQGISGAISGGIGCLISFLLTLCLAWGGKENVFGVLAGYFGITVLFFAVAGLVTTSLKSIPNLNNPQKDAEPSTSQSIFTYKPFYILILPNLLRGIGMGVINVVTVIGYNQNLLDATSAGVLAILLQAASISGSVVYAWIGRRFVGKTCLYAGIVCAALLPVMLMGNTIWFLSLYFVMYFAQILTAYDIPVAVTKFVSYEYIGQYSAWRMMLLTLGQAVGSSVTPLLLSSAGGIPTMIFASTCLTVCFVAYYVYVRKNPLIY